MASTAALDLLIELKGDAEKEVGKLSKATSKLGGIMKGVLKVGALGAAGAIVGLGKAALDTWDDFDKGQDTIVEMTGASGAALEEMSDTMKTLKGTSAGLGRGMDEIGAVMGEVARRTGLTGKGLEGFSSQVLKMTKITGGDAADAVRDVTRLMGQWQVPMEESAGLMDKLFGAGQKFGVSMESLTGNLQKFGPTLQNMGFSLDESIGLMGQFEQAGVNSEIMLAGLNKAQALFAKEGKDVSTGLTDTINAIKNATSQEEAMAIAFETFGPKAGASFVQAIKEGKLNIDAATLSMDGMGGSIDKTTEATLDFPDRWEMMTSRLSTALIPVGQGLMDFADMVLPHVEGALTTIATKTGEFFEAVKSGDPEAIKAFWSDIGGPIGTVGQSLTDAAKFAADFFVAVTAGDLSATTEQFRAMGEAGQKLADMLEDFDAANFTAFLDSLSDEEGQGIGGFKETVDAIMQTARDFKTGWDGLIQGIADAWNMLGGPLGWEHVVGPLEEAGKEISTEMTAIRSSTEAETVLMRDNVGLNFQELKKKAIDECVLLSDGAADKFRNIKETAQQESNLMKQGFINNTATTRVESVTAIEGLRSDFADKLDSMATKTDTATTKMKNLAVGNFTAMKDECLLPAQQLYDECVGNSIIPDLADKVVEEFGKMETDTGAKFLAMSGEALRIMAALPFGINLHLGKVADEFNKWLDQESDTSLNGIWRTGFSEMFNRVINWASKLRYEHFQPFFNNVGGLFESRPDQWASKWDGAMESMVASTRDAVNRILAELARLPSSVGPTGGSAPARGGFGAATVGAGGGQLIQVFIDGVPVTPRQVKAISQRMGNRDRGRHPIQAGRYGTRRR